MGGVAAFGQQPASAAIPGVGPQSAQKMVAYFRIWRDKAYTKDGAPNQTTMADLPPEVDIAIAFGTFDDPNFAAALRDVYVPKLHKQGTKVISSVFIDTLIDPAFSNDPAGYERLAEKIYQEWVVAFGLDGIDIDVERGLNTSQLKQATGVFAALRKKLGPNKLLVFDTNLDGNQPLFKNVAPLIDYMLLQAYGRSVSGLQGTWNTFRGKIKPAQFLVGFSFYEERDLNRWGDTKKPFETSRAYQYAMWQPLGSIKGGSFSYAVDRDGVADGDDVLRPTTYSWTKNLKKAMLGTYLPGSFKG